MEKCAECNQLDKKEKEEQKESPNGEGEIRRELNTRLKYVGKTSRPLRKKALEHRKICEG